MKSKTSGFTIVEVLLFLAVSAALLMGIIFSATSQIHQQRYEDAVQNFAEFLRTTYSEVSNPRGKDSGDGGGRSNYAMYGKLVTFGETGADKRINIYDVVGDVEGEDLEGTPLQMLKTLHADVIKQDNGATTLIANSSDYSPNWDAKIEKIGQDNHDRYVGAALIVRAPISGTIYTYTLNNATVEVQKAIENGSANVLNQMLDSFGTDEANFCVAAEGFTIYGGRRYNVRITDTSHDASGVEIISLDSEDNKCQQ